MIKAIIYKSNTGFSKKYAELLSKEIKLPLYSLEEKNVLCKDDEIIFIGSIFAKNINGYKVANKQYNIKYIIAVGMSLPSDELIEEIKEINRIKINSFIYLQGGLDKTKLKGIKKIMINMISSSLQKAGANTESDKIMIDMFQNGGDCVKEENLKDIIQWYYSL